MGHSKNHGRRGLTLPLIKTQLESPPRTLWLGVLLEPALLAGSPAMEWLEDFVRCLSWSGLAAAHKRGVAIGRPRALTPEQILMAEAEQFGIHRSTLYRHLNARQKGSA